MKGGSLLRTTAGMHPAGMHPAGMYPAGKKLQLTTSGRHRRMLIVIVLDLRLIARARYH